MAAKEEGKLPHLCFTGSKDSVSAASLCEHVGGHKQMMNVKRAFPRSLSHLLKLQYFFDTHMEKAPLVGLEFVEEIQKKNGYKYRCLLCGFHGDRQTAIQHITRTDHINKYILNHHPELSVDAAKYPREKKYRKAVQKAAAKVCKIYGKKRIKEISSTAKCPIPEKVEQHDTVQERGVVHDQNRELHDKPLYLESKEDQCGFSGNADFLAYLQTFKIQDGEDARVVEQITQNCTQALVRYWQDQAQANKPPWKALETVRDPAQLFFDRIQNMEDSEMVDTLHKIAATNPAYSGNIMPSVIQYLRETGRLKAA